MLGWGRGSGSPYAGAHTSDLPLLLGDERVWGAVARASGIPWRRFDAAGRQLRAIWAGFARDGALAERHDELIDLRLVG